MEIKETGRELDSAVAAEVLGYKVLWATDTTWVAGRSWTSPKGEYIYYELYEDIPYRVLDYRIDVKAAMDLVVKLEQDDFWFSAVYKTLTDDNKEIGPMYRVRFRCVRGATRGEYHAYAHRLESAICLAALKVVRRDQ